MGPSGIVEPDIRSLNQITGQVHIVIFQKYKSMSQPGLLGKFNQLLDQLLALVVFGVCLARKDELDWKSFRVDHRF